MRALFGTDGIRGEAGVPPLDAATVSKVGAALATSLGRPRISVVVGCDTRVSSGAIVAALSGGLVANGAFVRFAGVVPTPAVAWLTRELKADAGVSISASHNPWKDNGIKIFSAEGRKLPDEVELEIERHIEEAKPAPMASAVVEPDLGRAYVTHLAGSLPHRLDGLRVVVDAAHGAAFEVAPAAFRASGADVVARNVAPDGRNINAGCGALHPAGMARDVVSTTARPIPAGCRAPQPSLMFRPSRGTSRPRRETRPSRSRRARRPRRHAGRRAGGEGCPRGASRSSARGMTRG